MKDNLKEEALLITDVCFDKLFSMITGSQQRARKPATWQTKNKPRQPWATQALLKLVAEKTRVYKRYSAERDDRELYKSFKETSNRVKRETRKCKQNYYSKLLNENESEPRKYWEVINNVRGVGKTNSINKITINNTTLSLPQDTLEIANSFNEYFSEVPHKLLKKIEATEFQGNHGGNGISQNDNVKKCKDKIANFKLTTEDVEKAITKLKCKKSTGYDGVSSQIVKNHPKFFAGILTPLCNVSLMEGIFPEKLKPSIIIPILKSGDPEDITNYRPISLLSVFSKIFELCVKEKFVNYLEHIKFLSPSQFGFTKGRSTDTALFTHINDITRNVENNRATVGVYLDLAKAFDTVSHKRLLQKLKQAGVEGPLHLWFASYLTSRMHRVKIGEIYSEEKLVEFGVPQGSVLGPILFNFYINDLYELPLKARVIGYADDTSLLYSAATQADVEQDFLLDCKILLPWFAENRLSLNKEKCECIVFAYKTPQWAHNFELKLDKGEVIKKTQKVKYLGLLIDEKLTWNEHSIKLQAKLRKLNYLFYYMKQYFSRKHLIRIYVPLYESVLSYGIIHWGASAHIRPLKVLQNRVCRSIENLNRLTSEEEIYAKMGVMGLENLHKLRLLMFIFKNKEAFRVRENVSATRTGGGMMAVDPKMVKYHSRIQASYQGFKIFNRLPSYLRSEMKISIYKKLIKNLIQKGKIM